MGTLSEKDLLAMHRLMVLCRVMDEACCKLHGNWYTSQGEEAVQVGTFYGLGPEDVCGPNYRGAPVVYIMRGASLERFFGGVLGKATGFVKGRNFGFTAPIELGILPYLAGDLGPMLSQATGTAFAMRYKKTRAVTVVSCGDGTTNRGDFHEAINMGAAWKLPVVYVIQNNQYAISLHVSKAVACKELADRAAGYGIPGVAVDGNDVTAVHAAVQEAVARARAGLGPSLIEAKTYRLGGHYAADPTVYRRKEEVEEWRGRDPIRRLEEQLDRAGLLDRKGVEEVWASVRADVEAARAAAEAHPEITEADLGVNEMFATPIGGE